MRIWIRSDLHGRHGKSGGFVEPEHDVQILAGDIAEEPAMVILTTDRFARRPVVYVAGNHEFYGGVYNDRLRDARWVVEDAKFVHFLENDAWIYNGVRFLGCTLWSDFDLYGPDARGVAMAYTQAGMSDFVRIGWPKEEPGGQSPFRRFTPSDARSLHLESVAWLEERFAEPHDGPTVVVTHHAVSRKSIHPRWKGDSLTPGFVSNLEAKIERWQPDLWVHGHVHDGFDYSIGRTRVVCNPCGYGNENPAFDPAFVVEVGS